MFYLILAILSSAMVSITMRASEKYITNKMAMFMSNYAICIALSAAFMDWKNVSAGLGVPALSLGIISGILYLVSFIFLKYNMQHNGIVLSSTFMKLGVLIPTVMAVVVFHEVPRWTQVLGIGISVFAIIIIHFEKEALQESNKKIWLLLLLVLSGFTDSMANIYEQVGRPEGKDSYLLITFFTAFVLATVFACREKNKITRKDLLFGMLIGIPNYFSARFLLLALGSVDAVLAYPMYSVATMIVIMLAGVLTFHEQLSKKKAVALGMIVVAVCLLNM